MATITATATTVTSATSTVTSGVVATGAVPPYTTTNIAVPYDASVTSRISLAATTIAPALSATVTPTLAIRSPLTVHASASPTTPTTPPSKSKPAPIRKRRKLNTPVKTAQVTVPSPLSENRELKPGVTTKNVKSRLIFDPPLPQPANNFSPKPNIIGTQSVVISTTCTTTPGSNSVPVVGGYGMLITYPPIVPTDNEEVVEQFQQKRGIFDRAIESGTEMEWSSDESTFVSPTKGGGARRDLLNLCSETISDISHAITTTPPTDGFIKKGVWSEEESRCLLDGVEKFGEGRWKEIRAESYSILKHRTTNQLKDKYRNIKGRSKNY
jgi:hypothetical protein